MPSNDEVTRFTMRIRNDLYEKLKKLADENKRSIAKQIEFMIEKTLQAK